MNQHSDVGDQVIVLNDDAVDKLYERWQDPATVVRVMSPDSYLIDIGDGCIRHVHANKMRKYYVHVPSCDIISANDVYFGRVLVLATVESDVLPSVNVDRSSGMGLITWAPSSSVGCSRCLVSLLRVSVRSWFCAEFVERGCYLYFLCV